MGVSCDHRLIFVCIVAILSCWKLGARAQLCVPLETHDFDHADMCRFLPKHLNSPYIYLTNVTVNSTSDVVNNTLKELIYTTRLTAEPLKLAPERCRKAALAVTCSGKMLECFELGGVPVTIPRPPCRSACTTMVKECTDFLVENGVALPDCNATNALLLPNFPEEGWNVTLPNLITVFVPCNGIESKDVPDEFECPAPLIFDDKKDPRCNVPCPNPLYSLEQLHAYEYTKSGIATISIISATYIFITYLLNPRLRNSSGLIVLFLALSVIIFCIRDIMGWSGIEHVCKSKTDIGDRTVSFCLASSFFYYVGGQCIAYFFLVLTLNLFCILLLDFRWKRPTTLIISLLVWVFAITCWIIVVSLDKIGGSTGTCTVYSATSRYWIMGFQDIPLLTCLSISAIVMLPIMISLFLLKSKSGNRTKKWVSSLRVFCFVIYYFFALLTVETAAWKNFEEFYNIQEGVVNWVLCELRLENHCEERYKTATPLGYIFASSVMALISGIILFICFGVSEESMRWWKNTLNGNFQFRTSTTQTGEYSDSSSQKSNKSRKSNKSDKA